MDCGLRHTSCGCMGHAKECHRSCFVFLDPLAACLLQAGEIVDDDLNRVLINPLPTVSERRPLAGSRSGSNQLPLTGAAWCTRPAPPSRCQPQLPPTSGCLGCCRV